MHWCFEITSKFLVMSEELKKIKTVCADEESALSASCLSSSRGLNAQCLVISSSTHLICLLYPYVQTEAIALYRHDFTSWSCFFFCSLLKTMSPPKQIATGKRWFWMGKKSKLIYWIQQGRRTMLQLETTTSEVEKVFFASSLLQSWNPLQQLQTSGKLQGKIIILITLRWLKVIFVCVFCNILLLVQTG